MKDKLTSALANVLYVGVGATILTARATSNVATACINEGKSFCTDVKDKYDEKKSMEEYAEDIDQQAYAQGRYSSKDVL